MHTQRVSITTLFSSLIGGLAVVCLTLSHLTGATPAAAQRAREASPPAAVEAPAQPAPRRVVIRFLTDSDYPPFNYLDEDGVLVGFNVDLARAVCLELSMSCDIKTRPWPELLPALKRGETDAVIAGHAITPRALAEVDFTDRYFFTPGRFAAKRALSALSITPEGLDGRRIGVAKGTAHEAFLRAFFRDSAIVPFDTPDRAREALVTGKVDLVFDDGVSLVYWVNGTISESCCELKGGPFLEPRFFGDGVGIAVPKGDPELKGLINQALQRVRATGRYEELMLRYFPQRVF